MSRLFDKHAVSNFLNRFSTFEKEILQKRLYLELIRFKILFEAFKPVNKRLQEILLTTAPDYNIFSVLNISHYETRVHTPFLCHLIDPKESHKQGRLFFDSFFKVIFKEEYEPAPISNIQVFEEFYCSYGRIDILIFYQYSEQKRALVIENKIYHHDEPEQLERYYKYLTEDKKFKKGQYHLMYLTPNKAVPSNYSISDDIYKRLKKENSLFELGYKQDIAPWLETISQSVQAPNVKQTLLQYIKTIKAL